MVRKICSTGRGNRGRSENYRSGIPARRSKYNDEWGEKKIKRSGINFEFQQLELDAIITDLIIQNFDSFNPMCN